MILNDISQVEKIIKKYPKIYLWDGSVSNLQSWNMYYKGMNVMYFWYNSIRDLLLFKPRIDDSFNYTVNYIVPYTENDFEKFCQSLSLKYKKIKIRQRINELEKDFKNKGTKHTRKKKYKG